MLSVSAATVAAPDRCARASATSSDRAACSVATSRSSGERPPLSESAPLALRLLEFDVLAFEPSGHADCDDLLDHLQYSTDMHSAHDLLTRWPRSTSRQARSPPDSLQLSPVPADTLRSADDAAARGSLWRRDPAAWSADPRCSRRSRNRLGWLDSPALMADSLARLQTFADGVKRDGFTDVVLLGMGGSSLAPEVLRAVLGVAPGWPRLHMLDSTDPAAVRAAATPPEHTLYLISSKSGTTIEPNSLAAHFRRTLEDARVADWADHFVAITDEGTALGRARARGALSRCLHQPVGHRRTLFGAVVLRARAGGADGPGHRARSSAGASRCSPPPSRRRRRRTTIRRSRSDSRSAPRRAPDATS